jgi:hypothetical protein
MEREGEGNGREGNGRGNRAEPTGGLNVACVGQGQRVGDWGLYSRTVKKMVPFQLSAVKSPRKIRLC